MRFFSMLSLLVTLSFVGCGETGGDKSPKANIQGQAKELPAPKAGGGGGAGAGGGVNAQ